MTVFNGNTKASMKRGKIRNICCYLCETQQVPELFQEMDAVTTGMGGRNPSLFQ
jgi:hypothetical protein